MPKINPILKAVNKSPMNLTELAKVIGVSAAQVSRYVHDIQKPPYEKAKLIVGVLSNYGLTMKDLGYFL